jgi:hypothetical protein
VAQSREFVKHGLLGGQQRVHDSAHDRRVAADIDCLIRRDPSELAAVLAEIGDELGIRGSLEVRGQARGGAAVRVDPAVIPRERMILIEFKAIVRNTLRGFCILDIPPGLILRDVSVHEKNGRRWASLPSKPVLDSEGRHVVTHSGQKRYAALLGWRNRELADRFSARVVELVLEAHPRAFDDADANRQPQRGASRALPADRVDDLWPKDRP